jgi:hypothetical protein
MNQSGGMPSTSSQLLHALLTIITWSTAFACSCIRSRLDVTSGDSGWVTGIDHIERLGG